MWLMVEQGGDAAPWTSNTSSVTGPAAARMK
jgi:hypothetical protein